MEVNLAIFIMAVAVLGMVALYPLGFRESQHARDDVTEAAVADGILNPLVSALSATNITWTAWKGIIGASNKLLPNNGWEAYCATGSDDYGTPLAKNRCLNEARGVLNNFTGKPLSEAKNDALQIMDDSKMTCALVLSYGELPLIDGGSGGGRNGYIDYSRIVICLRVARRAQQLFEQPIFYSEVHFQGDAGN